MPTLSTKENKLGNNPSEQNNNRITALTPATVSMKFVNAIWLCFWFRAEEKDPKQR
jgi:hypothetical protein